MDPELYSTRHGGLPLYELIQILEEDGIDSADIYITPPRDGENTDEDSDQSDDECEGNINNLGRATLRAEAEVVVYSSTPPDAGYDENDLSVSSFVQQKQTVLSPHAETQFTPSDADSSEDDMPLSSFIQQDQTDLTSSAKKRKKNVSKTNKNKKVLDKNITKSSAKKTKKNEINEKKWSAKEPNFELIKNCNPQKPPPELANKTSTVDFFLLFFDDDVLKNIVDQSNAYALEKNANMPLNLTTEELYVVFGGFLLSGYGKYTNKRMYWAREDDVPKILASSMRLNRFEFILRHLHLNDNMKIDGGDKLYKLRPLISNLNKNFRKYGGLEESLSIDESMIPYYGKHYAKQYIKGKPIRFGFKNWALCTDNGYMIAFDIYTGKSNKQYEFGLGGEVVLSLLELGKIPSNEGYKVFIDNYFTSIALLEHLSDKGYCASGTIRDNRMEDCPLRNDKKDKKWNQQNRGHFEYRISKKVAIVLWKDNKVVCAGTNYDGIGSKNVQRYSREQKSLVMVPQPELINGYNKGMGGVDKLDQSVANYRTRMRQRKWWWPIFAYLFDVSVVNAWLLMRKFHPNDPVCKSLLNFRRNLCLILLQTYGTKSVKGKIPPKPIDHVRYDERNHIVDYSPTDRRCAHCGKKSNFVCTKCDVGLHPKNCFRYYHTL